MSTCCGVYNFQFVFCQVNRPQKVRMYKATLWSVTTQNFKLETRNLYLTKSLKNNDVGFRGIKTKNYDMRSEDRPIKSLKEIPGPSSLPLIGSLHHFLPGGKFYKMDRQVLPEDLYKQYGPIVKLDKLLDQPLVIFVYDAESAAKIYKGEEPYPERPGVPLFELYTKKYGSKFYNIGALINSNGPKWKKMRSPANKVMLDPKFLTASYSEVLDKIAKEAVERFRSLRDKKNRIPNFTEEIQLFALESSAMVTLGRRLNCFRPDLPPDSYEKLLISHAKDTFMFMEKIDFRSDKFLNYRLYKKAMTVIAGLDRVVAHFIDITIKDLEFGNNSEITTTSTLRTMIHQNRDAALPMAVDSLVAGANTITHTLQLFLYNLALNADKQEKLREELLSGNKRKTYLRACMKESSRILPTIFGNARVVNKPYQILGYEIPAGTRIFLSHRIICRMENQFPRAHEFIPERWLVEKDHPLYYGNAHPYAHGPFGFGSRSCIGQRIAQMIMEALIVNMFKEFDVKWEGPPPKFETHTLNVILPPVQYVFNNLK